MYLAVATSNLWHCLLLILNLISQAVMTLALLSVYDRYMGKDKELPKPNPKPKPKPLSQLVQEVVDQAKVS